MEHEIARPRKIEKLGLTIQFRFFAETSDLDFGSAEDRAEIQQKIERGELEHFCAQAQAYLEGVPIGEPDYLGDCIYKSIDEFMEDPYCPDMVNAAIANAKAFAALTSNWLETVKTKN